MDSIKVVFFAFLIGAATCLPPKDRNAPIRSYINCTYSADATGTYVCKLNSFTPYGMSNITSVGGTHVSGKTNADVKKLVGNFGSIYYIPQFICSQFPNLEIIDCQNSWLNSIESYSFSGCKMLKKLNLEGNRINKIADFSFSQNKLLSEISLRSNSITSPSANAFSGLSGLETLILSSNPIGTLPSNFFSSMPNLLYVLLETASLSAINPAWFTSNLKLQQIVLSGNSITDIPAGSFTKLSELLEVSLNSNQLTTLRAASFGNHPKLQEISFSNNQINAIEKGALESMRGAWVDMDGNVCLSTNARANDYQAFSKCIANYKA